MTTMVFVTVYEKTQHMGFFEKFEFDASLIIEKIDDGEG
jgi:hypothetical protein